MQNKITKDNEEYLNHMLIQEYGLNLNRYTRLKDNESNNLFKELGITQL